MNHCIISIKAPCQFILGGVGMIKTQPILYFQYLYIPTDVGNCHIRRISIESYKFTERARNCPMGGRMVVECISVVRWGGSRAGDCMVAMHIVTLLSLYFSPPCTATACCYLNSRDERVRETHKKYQLKSALYMDCALCLCTFFHVNNYGKTIYKLVVLPFRGTLGRYWSPTLWCFIVFTDTRGTLCFAY